MAVTGFLYGNFFVALCNKEHDLETDVIKAMATTSAYTPDQDVHNYKDDVTNEVVGTGYAAGGATLTNDTVTYTGAGNVLKYDADDVVWNAATGSLTIRRVVVYNSTPGTDATRGLICYQSSDADITATNANLTVVWDAAGIFTITLA